MNIYYVDPNDVEAITPAANTPPWIEGNTYDVPTHGRRAVKHEPALDLYEEDNQVAAPPFGHPSYYYTSEDALMLSGAVQDIAAKVVRTRTYTRVSREALYGLKAQEILDYDNRVRYNAVDSQLAPAWWVILTRDAQSELTVIGIGANQREMRGLQWPTGINAPRVGIYNENNGNTQRHQILPDQEGDIQSATWNQIVLDWNTHQQQTGNATDASQQAFQALDVVCSDAYDAAYAQAQIDDPGGTHEEWDATAVQDPAYQAAWDDMANHDAENATWGYPPIAPINGTTARLLGI